MKEKLTLILVVVMLTIGAQAAAASLLDPMFSSSAPKDASRQAGKLIALILNVPRCEVFKKRLREAGKGNPAMGSTQLKFVNTMQDAKAAGCKRPD